MGNILVVPGDGKMTVFWFSFDNMEEPDMEGQFMVLSDPPTMQLTAKGKHKVEFKGLDNAIFYRFKICAMNENFRVESEWSTPAQPCADKPKTLYKQEKRLVIDKIMK